MRIGIISPKPPWFGEGQAKVVKEHAIRLAKNNEVEIFCCDPFGKDIGEYNWKKIKVYVYKGLTNAYLFSLKLFRGLREQKFDVIHAHGFTTFMPLVASLCKDRIAKRLIFQPHYHSIGSTSWFKLFRKIYDPLIGKFIIKKSDKILCVSEFEKDELKKKYDINNLEIIPNGINLEKFQKAKPFRFNGKLILYVGRIERYKNVHLIIKAMEYLPIDYHFYIIGSGSYKNKLEKLISKLNLRNRIKILSNVLDKDTARWYKTCSIFITLSEIEAFGITVLEALASDKPVVLNDATALSELAKKFKNAIKAVKAKEISAQKLAKIIKEQSGKKVKVDLESYDWNKIVKKIEEVYRR